MNDFDKRSAMPPVTAKLKNRMKRDGGSTGPGPDFPERMGESGSSVCSECPDGAESSCFEAGSGFAVDPSMTCDGGKRTGDENGLDVRIPWGSCPVEFTNSTEIFRTFSHLGQTQIESRGRIADLLSC